MTVDNKQVAVWVCLSGTKCFKQHSCVRPLPPPLLCLPNICDVILKREIKLWRCQQAQEEYLTLSQPFTPVLTPSGIQFKINKKIIFCCAAGESKTYTWIHFFLLFLFKPTGKLKKKLDSYLNNNLKSELNNSSNSVNSLFKHLGWWFWANLAACRTDPFGSISDMWYVAQQHLLCPAPRLSEPLLLCRCEHLSLFLFISQPLPEEYLKAGILCLIRLQVDTIFWTFLYENDTSDNHKKNN